MATVSASMLSCDFSAMGRDLERIQIAGADMAHLDIMDGAFVPNITFGAPVIKKLLPFKKIPFESHLMIENPERYINDFRDAGSDIIIVHAEATRHLDRLISQIKETGAKAGVALNPATPLSAVSEVLGNIDILLLMTVNPGFGGQKFISYVTEKVSQAAKIRNDKGLSFLIETDGGIDGTTGPAVAALGCDILVSGSYIFRSPDVKKAIDSLKNA
ncbi:MAG: ribulose-phosphate 3-epimerase [Clostridia bacterium]|nr:ribulose-phosphate 3-epimerase [Clostridia bacterium]